MTPNADTLALMFRGFSTLFNKSLAETKSYYRTLAMVVPSTTREQNYGWLGAMPNMREWLGDRIIHQLSVEGYKLRNREFEATVAVKRNDVEDDQYGIYGPMFAKMGADAARHPDKLTLGLLKSGFTELCYDGQFFFDTDHPVGGAGGMEETTVSNMQAGAGTPWFLLDCSQPLKPLLFQERVPYRMEQMDGDTDPNAFWRGEYVYGVRARCNAGYGLWQLAFGSRATLNAANYAAARAAMMAQRQDNGEPLGISPTHLVLPPSLEAVGLEVLKATQQANGASNVWANTAELVVTPFVM